MIPYPSIQLYEDGAYRFTVMFRKKWQAKLFHWILNKSIYTAGRVEPYSM